MKIFDHRTYVCRPGTVRKHLEIYAEHGYADQVRHLGRPFLYAMTDVGDVNAFVHVWVFEDSADRTARRAAMQADPEWQAYLNRSAEAGFLIRQENRILIPAPFVDG